MSPAFRRMLLAAPVAVGLAGCGAAAEAPPPASEAPPAISSAGSSARPIALPHGVEARLPAEWRLLRRRIDAVVYPVQVLAAASYPVEPSEPSGCGPGRVLDQRPTGGALVQVVEWTEGPSHEPDLADFPPRPRPFRLPERNFRSYECNGPSYNISFRDRGRAFQAFVWLDPERVDPLIRRQAIDLLSSLGFEAPADRR